MFLIPIHSQFLPSPFFIALLRLELQRNKVVRGTDLCVSFLRLVKRLQDLYYLCCTPDTLDIQGTVTHRGSLSNISLKTGWEALNCNT